MHSAVLIIPISLKNEADYMCEALGWGPTTFTIPIVALDDETGSPTHWAFRADVSTNFAGMVRGLTPSDNPAFATVLKALFADFLPDPALADDDSPALWVWEHFGAVLARQGLIHVAT